MAAVAIYKPANSWQLLQANIEREAVAVEECGSSAVQHAWQCGRYLIEAKGLIGHGNFVAYLNGEVWGRGERTAVRYMQIAMLNPPALADLTFIGEAERLASQQAKPRIRDRVLDFIRDNPGCTDNDIAEALEEKGASLRGRRKELEKAGLIKRSGSKKGERGKKPLSTYEATQTEEEVEQVKKKVERSELDQRADKIAATILSLDARTRAAVMRRVNSDRSVANSKMRKITKDQRFGDGTPKDHVRTCIVESFHRIGAALQQNGPGTNMRWVSTCSDDDKKEIRKFAVELAADAKTLSEYLSEIL